MSVTTLPRSRPFTAADLAALPDDGHRYELIDGTLIVTPSPSVPHQRALGGLYVILRQACPAELEVMLAPLDVTFTDTTVLQPDLLVATRAALSGRRLADAPLLAVEVASPSTRLVDLRLKFATYEREGIPSYWVVDPLGRAPAITAWELTDDGYREVAAARGRELFSVSSPFEVSFRPDELLR